MIYLFYGEEEFLIDSEIKKLISKNSKILFAIISIFLVLGMVTTSYAIEKNNFNFISIIVLSSCICSVAHRLRNHEKGGRSP